MEVKINKDIRDFTENIFFGLSMRQFIFSLLACSVALIVHFALKPYLGTETLSWVCILCAAPFAVLGFLKYNGMTAEKFLITWFKSNFLIPKHIKFKNDNFYGYEFRNIINNNLNKGLLKPQNKKKERKNKKEKQCKRRKVDAKNFNESN